MRRKRSHMTEADCLEALRVFAGKVERMVEGSMGCGGDHLCPSGSISVQFQLKGGFGVGGPIFEAIRVLGGHKLPAAPSPPREKQ